MIRLLKYTLIFFIIVGTIGLINDSLSGCNKSTEPESTSAKNAQADNSQELEIKEYAPYEIFNLDPSETRSKALIKCSAFLLSDSITEGKITGTLNKIYSELKDYNKFERYSSPTVIVVYLYTSKDMARNMSGNWIAMLSKTPSNSQPEVRFDEFKLSELDMNKAEKSNDEVVFEMLKSYFSERKTDLCDIYKTLDRLYLSTIKQADSKYPEFGDKHLEYQNKLYDKEKMALFKKHNIHDSMSVYITVYGHSYCK